MPQDSFQIVINVQHIKPIELNVLNIFDDEFIYIPLNKRICTHVLF